MKIRIKKAFMHYNEDQVIDVKSIDDIPTEKFWRDRLKDACHDDCCEVVKKQQKTKKKETDE